MARLKVLVFDPIAAGGIPARPLPQSLKRQGDMLHQALLADLDALSGIEVVSMTGSGAAPGHPAGVEDGSGAAGTAAATEAEKTKSAGWTKTPSEGQATAPSRTWPAACSSASAPMLRGMHRFGAHLVAGMQAADAVWPLASESDGVLECLSLGVLRGKRILLGSAPGAVEVAASKLKLARVLADGGVAAVATYSPHAALPQDGGPWVVKPDDGAGCLDTRLFGDRAAALAWIRAHGADGYVLQPFVAGKLGSLSLICCDGAARVLACNQERVAMHDNRFHFLGSVVNGLADDDGVLARLAQQVAAAIPSLWGYVGVDFVLTAHGAMVLDVNPRLTAAYAGLHASIGCNPAGLVLDLLNGPGAMTAPALPAGMRRAVSVDVGVA